MAFFETGLRIRRIQQCSNRTPDNPDHADESNTPEVVLELLATESRIMATGIPLMTTEMEADCDEQPSSVHNVTR